MKKVILIGNPVSQSLSPALHNHWLAELGIEGFFEARKTEAKEIKSLISDLRGGRLAGINVTIPHKETAFSLLDEFSEAAGKIGAANTLYITQGKLAGKNTDPEGFMENLKFSAPDWDPSGTALVLGTGAAAKAVIYALQKAGQKNIFICGRNLEKAKGLEKTFSEIKITCLKWQAWEQAGNEASLLINTTPLGLPGFGPVNFDLTVLKENALVYDLVYGREKTDFLKTAQARGLKTVDGLGMLVFQAIPAFETWFGKRPVMEENLLNILRNKR